MRHGFQAAVMVLVVFVAAWGHAQAQASEESKGPDTVIVSIYRIAPGQHVSFLEWMASREAVSKELGLKTAKWFAHADGDSWDYITIGPENSEADEKRIEAATKKKGLTTGYPAAIELRRFISSHTDTFAAGPTTATKLLSMAKGSR